MISHRSSSIAWWQARILWYHNIIIIVFAKRLGFHSFAGCCLAFLYCCFTFFASCCSFLVGCIIIFILCWQLFISRWHACTFSLECNVIILYIYSYIYCVCIIILYIFKSNVPLLCSGGCMHNNYYCMQSKYEHRELFCVKKLCRTLLLLHHYSKITRKVVT